MPQGPFRLVTVNTAPERAKRLVGRAAEVLKHRFTIDHVSNCESEYAQSLCCPEIPELTHCQGIGEVEAKVREFQPDMVVSD
jgi:hypothetical protein